MYRNIVGASECVLQVDGTSTTLSMSVHFKQLKRLVEEPTFSQVLIPLQSVLIPTLPSTGGANKQHDAFPGHWAYLDGFEDTVRDGEFAVVIKGFSWNLPDGKICWLYSYMKIWCYDHRKPLEIIYAA